MVAVNSLMLPLGTKLPSFKLEDTQGQKVHAHTIAGPNGLLVAFISNHCPYVKHIQAAFAVMADKLISQKIGVVAISSNDVSAYPDDSLEHLKIQATENHFNFPYLLDTAQTVAKAFKAMCTPDFFLFNDKLQLFYRGQMDGSRPRNDIIPTGHDILEAAARMTNHEEPPQNQRASIGCNIKWKKGQEPDYYLKHISGESSTI